jgi:crotonobetainyl-CoA:carnitine CoA-transferase CaiB-like acyl-CoA transferase
MLAHAKRLATGQGSFVDVSVQEAVANMLTNTQQQWFAERRVEHRGAKHAYGGRMTHGVFPAKDGYIASHIFWGPGPGNRMRGLAHWMQDKGFETTIKDTDFNRVTGGAITQEQVDAWEDEMSAFFSRFNKDEIYREALKRRAFLFPVSSPKDLLSNEQLKARGFFEHVEHPELKERVTYPGAFLRWPGAPHSIRLRPPLIGEHNIAIYVDELGYTRDELVSLAEAGVI